MIRVQLNFLSRLLTLSKTGRRSSHKTGTLIFLPILWYPLVAPVWIHFGSVQRFQCKQNSVLQCVYFMCALCSLQLIERREHCMKQIPKNTHLALIKVFHTNTVHSSTKLPGGVCLQQRERKIAVYQSEVKALPASTILFLITV